MNETPSRAGRDSREAGFTIVEMSVVAALLVAIVSFTFGTIAAVTTYNEYGESKLAERKSPRSVFTQLRKEFLRTTLTIERARFGARLKVEEAIEPGLASLGVPGLLLQPRGENAGRPADSSSA